MRTVLVTLIGPEHTTDLVVDAQTPVSELMGSLLGAIGVDVAAEEAPERWSLALTGKDPVSPGNTLEEAGVLDGAVLVLRRGGPSAGPPSRAVTGRIAPGPAGSPLRRTRDLLSSAERSGDDERLWRRLRVSPPEATQTPEARLSALERTVREAPLLGCRTIAVLSPKGGVGKTTVSILLGEALSGLREEPILALDGDSDYGSLGRVGPLGMREDGVDRAGEIFDSLARGPVTFAELDRTLWPLPSGLRIVPSPRDPVAMADTDRATYTRVLGNLQRLAGALVVDCGTGLGQPGVQAAVLACDQLVLVTEPAGSSASLAVEAFGLLERSGRPITVVGNRLRRGRGAAEDLARLAASVPRAAGLVGIPDEPEATRALGGDLRLQSASRPLRQGALELAAVLAAAWAPRDPHD